MTTEIKRGQGAAGSFNERRGREITREINNSLTIVETWQCDTPSFLTVIPAKGDAHPSYTTTYLLGPVKGKDKNGITDYTLIYSGFDANTGGTTDPADSPPRYWWEPADKTVPIEYLERDSGAKTFAALVTSARAGGYDPLDAKGNFIGFPAGSMSAVSTPLGGITDYLDVGGSWNCERFSATPPDVTKSCTYVATASVPGGPQETSPDADWLYLTPGYEEIAPGLYFIREKWIPSAGGTSSVGWNAAIYDPY